MQENFLVCDHSTYSTLEDVGYEVPTRTYPRYYYYYLQSQAGGQTGSCTVSHSQGSEVRRKGALYTLQEQFWIRAVQLATRSKNTMFWFLFVCLGFLSDQCVSFTRTEECVYIVGECPPFIT